MKIIKQFDDFEFFERHYGMDYSDDELGKSFWRWGLGNDGELYYQNNARDSNPKKWLAYPDEAYGMELLLTFSEMRRLVKEFGHLVILT